MTETRPVAAAASIVVAMAIIGFIDNFVVVIAAEAGIWQFHFLRALIAVPFFVLAVRIGIGTVRPRRWRGVLGRSFFLTLAMISYFASLGVLPIAQAVAGLFTSPIFVVLISALVLGERIGRFRIAAVAIGFLGILLILRPEASHISIWTVVPILAGFFYAISAIATRAWCDGEDTLALLAGSFAGLGVAGILGLALFTLFPVPVASGPDAFVLQGWVEPSGTFLFWTLVQAIGSIVGVFFIIRAYQLGEASYVGVFEYSLLVFVSVWAWVLRNEVVDLAAAAGIVLIVISGIVIAVRSRSETRSGRLAT